MKRLPLRCPACGGTDLKHPRPGGTGNSWCLGCGDFPIDPIDDEAEGVAGGRGTESPQEGEMSKSISRSSPKPTMAQRHPQASYIVHLRFSHDEAEALKAAVAGRCLTGAWAPESDDADWALQRVVQKLLEHQGVIDERTGRPHKG